MSAKLGASARLRIVRQGALLLSGYAGAQALSFARNAIIGHWLSKGDFGIAAAITLMLQLLETLSDLGADRLIIQSSDGDEPRLLATAHTTLVARGAVMAALLYLAAGPTALFFGIEQARWAFEAAALVPLVKGFMHLDPRRYQRQLHNRAQMLVETAPQVIALAATIPMLLMQPGYSAVLWLAILQAIASLIASHALAERPYVLAVDRGYLHRLLAFGWPIWLSAFPLIAVHQGDRLIIGRLLGIEELAAYTTAFMVTMVPSLVAAKVGQSLLLPLLSSARGDDIAFKRRYVLASEAAALGAALYLVALILVGGDALVLAFGPNYAGLATVVCWLAAMWSLRMLQAVPGMALMALGDTRPFLIAGLLRAGTLPLALVAATCDWGIEGVAMAGVLGELASLAYVAWRVDRDMAGLARALLARSLLLGAATLIALVATSVPGADTSLSARASAVLLVAAVVTMLGLAAFRSLRVLLEGILVTPARQVPATD